MMHLSPFSLICSLEYILVRNVDSADTSSKQSIGHVMCGLKLRAHNAAKLKLGLVYTVHYTRDVHKRLCTHWVGRTWVRS